ncbi:hypothetical protein PENARI_c023G02801 [Penicillium arizonense]|uniref:DUF7730 domain-containing protein n=1 Tax=Penicillium arizonense TaxID=1835702 RepID=A0A1F5L8F6_PENAI|nr:hypothetical protein PENARI_c023G02801 [Penicillium arizonense]OGE49201.1 hypothetical protein PENARI_c023G02801 [Penicillium arizonense]
MAPHFFNRLFKRKKKGPKEPRFTLQEWSPNAIGIWDSTCEINGDRFNRWKLPIQAKQRHRSPVSRQKSPQQQSPLFRLPAEIRRLIYLELMGGRRLHIRYFWRKPSLKPRSEPRWHWWHIVCDHSDGFIDDPVEDICSILGGEGYMHTPRPKIGSVEWLRCCQIGYEEALEVLYETNVFVMDEAIDTPFLISRILAPCCACLMTFMDISFVVGFWGPGQAEEDWMATYYAFFGLFEKSFRSVLRLRVLLRMPPCEAQELFYSDEKGKTFLKPWERLLEGREWTRLQLCVPFNWHDWFQEIKGSMPELARLELVSTSWSDHSGSPADLAWSI